MSGRRYWGLINHLVNFTPNAAYLEVGSWKGSTACAAMAGNQVKMQCIDDWSEYGGPKEEFFANTGRWLTPDIEFDFLEQDCNETDFGALGPFNIYFFDGPHSMPDTFNGIVNAQDALTPVHTLIMDDWNWPFVRKGTQDALDHLAHDVLATLKIRTTQDGSHPAIACEQSDWHNGYFIAVCRKQSAVG